MLKKCGVLGTFVTVNRAWNVGVCQHLLQSFWSTTDGCMGGESMPKSAVGQMRLVEMFI